MTVTHLFNPINQCVKHLHSKVHKSRPSLTSFVQDNLNWPAFLHIKAQMQNNFTMGIEIPFGTFLRESSFPYLKLDSN
ncbi:hypothetical protein BLOT_007878 [Blomia tropicalis]|nr:hypothetical protein BLOT_007878 [Blomia tropicalis]